MHVHRERRGGRRSGEARLLLGQLLEGEAPAAELRRDEGGEVARSLQLCEVLARERALAVVVGGTALAGGRFYLAGTIIGAVLIQTLTTTIYSIGIPPETNLLFKALVVTAVCLIQSPAFREKMFRRRHRTKLEPSASDQDRPHEVPA